VKLRNSLGTERMLPTDGPVANDDDEESTG
jgi:hypothetical protein